MSIETWLAFFVACWIISLSPGAGAIASMSSGLNYDFARGYWTALGLQLGQVVQIAVDAAETTWPQRGADPALHAVKQKTAPPGCSDRHLFRFRPV